MMSNPHPETGVRYGVIATHSLDPDLENELWFGPGATDVTYEAAYKQAKKEAKEEFEDMLEEAEIAAAEIDHNMCEEDRERFIAGYFRGHGFPEVDCEMFVERRLERFSDLYQCDESEIEGTYEGVKYLIGWLGGAPLLWVIEGPLGFANVLCSPCVPNAADLDSGFEPTSLALNEIHRDHDGYLSYVVPQDWLRKE